MRSEVATTIFSKNRACQLELLLRTLSIPATVIYTYDPEFLEGYKMLEKMYPSVDFLFQWNLKDQIVHNISKAEYTLFLLDDDVMLNPFYEDCPEFEEFKSNPDILCLNLRMCSQYRHNGQPELKNNTWEWYHYRYKKHSARTTDWGYPMSTTSHIFRREDILPIILNDSRKICIPHHLERTLNRNPLFHRKLMLCFDEAKVISVMANQVQSEYPCPNYGVSLSYLEEEFLKGRRLSFEDIKEKAKKAAGCLMIEGYKWERE
jgi:hypothetical protein